MVNMAASGQPRTSVDANPQNRAFVNVRIVKVTEIRAGKGLKDAINLRALLGA